MRARRTLFVALLLATTPCAAAAQTEEWTGSYRCGAMKSDPENRPGYSSPAKLVVKDGVATMSRDSARIRESLSGKVAEDGRVTLEGTGVLKDSGSSWRYRFEGRIEGNKLEASGGMYPPRGGAVLRDCSMNLTRVGGARQAKPAAPAPVVAEAPKPAPPPVLKPEPKPEPPAPPKKAEPAQAQQAVDPPKAAEPPKPEPISPTVQAALESPAPPPDEPRRFAWGNYSRTDLAFLALFIAIAVAGAALVVVDWRRSRRR